MSVNTGKSWKEHNREHKEKRKLWREERLIKKVKKEETAKEANAVAAEESKRDLEKPVISTVSIAVPGSILDNAQSAELRTYLAGQIARAACVFKIDEVVVFDDKGEIRDGEKKKTRNDESFGEQRIACLQLARILQYLECPQYLRKHFFPLHQDLQYAGVLNPLDAPHHLRQQDFALFREGIVTNKPIKHGKGSQVNVGLLHDVHVDKVLPCGTRVTVKMPENQENPKKLKGRIVTPLTPRAETGIYWGYSVRLAANLTEVIAKSPYSGGYDLCVGTSDKGQSVDDLEPGSLGYNHAIVVFGGLSGLESALELDPNLDLNDPALLFDKYINTCPQQGSRTIRTEEAILLSLSELRNKLVPKNPALSHPQFVPQPANDPKVVKNGPTRAETGKMYESDSSGSGK